jgi:hypothetical protein
MRANRPRRKTPARSSCWRAVNDFETGIPGESGLVESENGGEAMRQHRRDKPRVMRGFTHYLMLDD